MAVELPRSPDDLRRCRGVAPQTVQRHGEDLLAAVQRGLSLPDAELPPPVFQPSRDPAFRKAVDAALGQVLARVAARHVDPALVCSRNELAMLLHEGAAARPEAHRLLRGWRAELMGDALAVPPA